MHFSFKNSLEKRLRLPKLLLLRKDTATTIDFLSTFGACKSGEAGDAAGGRVGEGGRGVETRACARVPGESVTKCRRHGVALPSPGI